MEDSNNEVSKHPYLYTIAISLIALGAVIAIFIAIEILSVYSDVDSNQFISKLTGFVLGLNFITLGVDQIIIGEGAAKIVAIFLFVSLTWVSIRLVSILIRGGVQLISPEMHVQLAGIKHQMNKLMRDTK